MLLLLQRQLLMIQDQLKTRHCLHQYLLFLLEKNIENTDETKSKDDKQQSYRISGGVITLNGKDSTDLELTTDEKIAFQETMDEFVDGVSDLVDFEPLNLYKTDVEWGGKIIDFDIEFYFTIGENNGIYINGTMMKVDEVPKL